jgi:hypothetical protein
MSYALVYDVPATEEMYRQVRSAIGDEQPKGLVAHLVVHAGSGLRHIGVWDSQQRRSPPLASRITTAPRRAHSTSADLAWTIWPSRYPTLASSQPGPSTSQPTMSSTLRSRKPTSATT